MTSASENNRLYEIHQAHAQMAYARTPMDDPTRQYQLDRNLSDANTKVYVDPISKRVAVAYRGTDPSLGKDIKTAWHALTGTERNSHRHRKAVARFDEVHTKYPDHHLTTVGHSSGGSLATYVNKQRPGHVDSVVTYNRAASVLHAGKRADNHTDIVHRGDLIAKAASRQRGGHLVRVGKSAGDLIRHHALRSLRFG